EVKYNFSGVKSILGAGNQVGGHQSVFANLKNYIPRFGETFSQALTPNNILLGNILSVIVVTIFVYLLTIYLFSSSTMLILGYHGAPWFLIGLTPAIIICISYLLSKLKLHFLIPILFVLLFLNLNSISKTKNQGQILLTPDRSAIMSKQLAVIDYTYNESDGEKFVVNTLTNPLYINAVWGYHYDWYGKKNYGYIPTWGGGDQLPPYNTLQNFKGGEKYLYLIIDQSPRIPYVHTILIEKWADERSKLIEKKEFDGILVEKREIKNNFFIVY
ncbi:hypothetical protein KW795_01835, partial [Candidatus Microgenomates bacterium]|nr:hypothetical protein [Candidatus Microgenomates bacterium]